MATVDRAGAHLPQLGRKTTEDLKLGHYLPTDGRTALHGWAHASPRAGARLPTDGRTALRGQGTSQRTARAYSLRPCARIIASTRVSAVGSDSASDTTLPSNRRTARSRSAAPSGTSPIHPCPCNPAVT